LEGDRQSDSINGLGFLNQDGQMVIRSDSGEILVDLKLSEELLRGTQSLRTDQTARTESDVPMGGLKEPSEREKYSKEELTIKMEQFESI